MLSSRHRARRRWLIAGAALALGISTALAAGVPAWAAIANDDFANAQMHTASFTDYPNTFEASLESGEPQPSCTSTVGTAWYKITPSGSGAVSITSFGMGGGAGALAVYTGSTLGSLTQIACGAGTYNVAAEVSFTATASVDYWLQAGGISNIENDLFEVIATLPAGPSHPDLTTTVAESADPISLGGTNLRRVLAPLAATGLLGWVLYLTVQQFDVLLGVAPDSPLRWAFPASFAIAAILGLFWAGWLKLARPLVYATIGLGANAAPADSPFAPPADTLMPEASRS